MLIVKKFGGSSVANAERINHVAQTIVNSYKEGNQVVVVLSAHGDTTDELIEKAKETDVPTYEDSKLAKTLSNLEVGDMIPPELYTVVAEILVFVDKTDKLRGKING